MLFDWKISLIARMNVWEKNRTDDGIWYNISFRRIKSDLCPFYAHEKVIGFLDGRNEFNCQ